MRRLARWTLPVMLLFVLPGCATMNVSSHIQRGVDFTVYRTFDWGPADALPTGDPRLDANPFFHDHLQGAFERRLTARGFVRAEPDATPDLLIHYHANVSQRFEVQGIDRSRGYCYDDCEPRVSEYEQGSIVVDVVDARTKKVVWRGWAQDSLAGVIDDQDRLERHIDRAVARMMDRFPVAGVPATR